MKVFHLILVPTFTKLYGWHKKTHFGSIQWLGLSYDAFHPTTCGHIVFHVKCGWRAKTSAVVGQDNFTSSHIYTVNDPVGKIEPQPIFQRYFELHNDKTNTCSAPQISYYPYPEIFFSFHSMCLFYDSLLSFSPTHILSLSHIGTHIRTYVHTHWHTWTNHPDRINSLLSVLLFSATPSIVYPVCCHQSPPLDSKLEEREPYIIILCMPYPVFGTW